MFLLSKILDLLINPLNFLFIWAAVATLLLYGKFRLWGRRLLSILIVTGLVFMIVPLDDDLAGLLEDRFAKPTVTHVDGVVVLGGAISVPMSVARGRPSINEAAERVTEMIVLMHRFPKAKIIFSGGSGNPFDQSVKEADILKKMLIEMGEDADRVVYEDQSRNTYENAVFSKKMANPADGQVWLLVTSAIHMPRAMGCFAAVHWEMIAWPVNYITQGQGHADLTSHILAAHRLQTLSNALHEGIGLVYYHLRGWTNAWLPSP